MPGFTVKYTDPRGEIREEAAAADSARAARRQFTSRGLLVHAVREERAAAPAAGRRQRGRLDLQQFVVFNAQLLALIRAGMPIPQSLQLLAGNIRNKALAAHIAAVRDQVQVGASLSEAFAARKAFPPIYVTSLLAGERSGALDAVLERYVEYQKLSLAIRKKILVSLIYPTILVALVLALVVFLVTYVVPEFAQLYETMDANLPVSTQLLVALGAAARDNALALLAAAAAASAAVTWALRREGRTRLDRLLLRVPVAGQLWIRYQVAQLARLLGTLLSGGVPLVRALETASESLGSGLLQGKLAAVRAKVREGQTLAASLQQADVFPPLSVEMVRVGESTGALPQMLASVAEFFDEEVQTKTAALLNLIEPAIMVFMGIFVAFVLISLYLPVFSLAEQF